MSSGARDKSMVVKAAACVAVVLAVVLTIGQCLRVPSDIKPNMPVRVSFRESSSGAALVAQFQNNSGKHLTIRMTLESPTVGETKEKHIYLRPCYTREKGWIEGWACASGDRITLYHEDYRTMSVKVP